MHDKDDSEFLACKTNNLISLLCEFHAVKLFEEKLPKYFHEHDEQVRCLEIIKSIQRSQDRGQLKKNSATLQNFWKKSPKFWLYFSKEWLGEWLSTWIDLDRPGQRIGLWNTNNASETFFKVLYHTFLRRRSRNPAQLLQELDDNVFLYYENILLKQSFRKNLSAKIKEFDVIDFDDLAGCFTLKVKDSEVVVDFKRGKCSCSGHDIQGKCDHFRYCERFRHYITPDSDSESEVTSDSESEECEQSESLEDTDSQEESEEVAIKPKKKRGRKRKKHLTVSLHAKKVADQKDKESEANKPLGKANLA